METFEAIIFNQKTTVRRTLKDKLWLNIICWGQTFIIYATKSLADLFVLIFKQLSKEANVVLQLRYAIYASLMFLNVALFQLFINNLLKLGDTLLAFLPYLHDFLSHLWDFFILCAIFLEKDPSLLDQLLHFVLIGASLLEYSLKLIQWHADLYIK